MSLAAGGARALVTGGTGFVGGHLLNRLTAEGWSVRALVRDPARLGPAAAGIEVVTGDLGDLEALKRAVTGCEVIFHCAANVATWGRLADYMAVNRQGVANLVDAVAAAGPPLHRLVHLSTVDVYGYPVAPCDETAPLDGAGFPYGESKLAGEILLRTRAATLGLPVTVLRPANIMGPQSQFVARIGAELRNGLMLMIDGGRANSGFTDVDNLLDLMLWAAEAEAARGECFNVRDQCDVDWATLLTRLRSLIGGRGRILDLPFAVAEASARALELAYRLRPGREPLLHRLLVRMFGRTCGHSAEKIRRASGLRDRIDFDAAMARSAAWFNGTTH
ncbi:NAD-dependent epimerase/dehydratase family protein [Zavarzinia sp.]|uniref:NAD-dependent epimerase/dehydratase family protein n=1 Tax=Zavarzinia sp. TaxID=2027920 RepID=UPI003561DA41